MSKKRNPKILSPNVISNFDGYWEWFDRADILTVPYKITGKYLFFSLNRNVLIEIVVDELENGGFYRAKTPMSNVTMPSGEFVLCLYYKDDSRKHELAKKYGNRIDLKYRYWKSDADTLAGKYSTQFLNQLTLNEQKMFWRKR